MNKLDEILKQLEKRLEILESGSNCHSDTDDIYFEYVGRIDELKDVILTVENIILKD